MEAVISATIPPGRVRPSMKTLRRISDFCLAPLHGLPSVALQIIVLASTKLKITSSEARSKSWTDGT